MIVTCPACATRYLTDPALLGLDGRMVRCAKCSHSWLQAPPPDMPQFIEPLPPPLGEPQGRIMLPARLPPRRLPRPAAGYPALVAVLLGLLLVGLYLGRERIAAAWPPAAELYRLAGLRVAPAGAGLELGNVTFVRRELDGEEIMAIQGEIFNHSAQTQAVPPLKATLRNGNNHRLTDWVFRIDQPALEPGETTTFRTTAKNPPQASKRLSITFVDP